MFKKILCYSLFILPLFLQMNNQLYAQDTAVWDSLKQKIATAPDDSTKARNMLFLAEKMADADPVNAMHLADGTLAIAKSKGIKVLELNSYVIKAVLFANLGKNDSSLFYYHLVIPYENDTAFAFPVGQAYGNLINYYRQRGELKTALECALKAEKIYLPTNKKRNLVSIYSNIGGIFFDLNDFDKALEYDFKGVALAKLINNTNRLPVLYNNIAGCYGEKQMPDSAMYYFRIALALAVKEKDYRMAIHITEAIGFEFYDAEQLDSANYYLLEAKKYYDEQEYYDDGYAMLYGYLGMLETKRKNYPLALTYLRIADSSSVDLSYMMDKIEIKKALVMLYEGMGNWQKAFEFQQQFIALNDSMQREENTKITRELEKKYDTAKKEKENIELKAQNDLAASQLKARNYLLIASGISLALLALLLFFIFRNFRNEKKHVAILDKLNLQLTNQRDEILNINQLLQLKVLRTQMNPHFIYNCLNSINNLVIKGETDKASSYLLSFARLLRMILDFSDNTFVDLEDEIKFIQLYLSLEAMRMGNEFSYEVNASQKILDDDIGVPSLIIQPFIENAIWHGLINKHGNKKLTVSFEQNGDDHKLTCIVEDNGIGREKAAQVKTNHHGMLHESKGIRITRERIELLQYRIKNEVSVSFFDKVNAANEPEGTLVKLILPANGTA